MIGELVSGRMQSYVRPVAVSVKVDDFEDLDFFGEVAIGLNLERGLVTALIPKRHFDEEAMVAYGLAIGQSLDAEFVLVEFAPTQNEQAAIEVPECVLTKL